MGLARLTVVSLPTNVLAVSHVIRHYPSMTQRYVIIALVSAALFGLSTPAAKLLLGSIDSAILAGLLYCGAGAGVAVLRRVIRLAAPTGNVAEAPLSRADAPWLAGAIVAGGVVGPLLLMAGLSRTSAETASLLLTLEGVATALLAWFVFRENFDRRIAIGMACLVAGALVLSWTGQPSWNGLLGPLAIAGACLAWGLDNNLTKKVSLADPLQIVELKGLIAGPINLGLGFWAGASLPAFPSLAIAMLVGFLGYGVSLALFVRALRHLGAARTGAYFATAPFIGALAALVLLHEPLTLQLLAAGALMAVGIWLHLTETHDHAHTHEPLEHEHLHTHDMHHQHDHDPGDPMGESHSHWHRHSPVTHSHPHVPDTHHPHRH